MGCFYIKKYFMMLPKSMAISLKCGAHGNVPRQFQLIINQLSLGRKEEGKRDRTAYSLLVGMVIIEGET